VKEAVGRDSTMIFRQENTLCVVLKSRPLWVFKATTKAFAELLYFRDELFGLKDLVR